MSKSYIVVKSASGAEVGGGKLGSQNVTSGNAFTGSLVGSTLTLNTGSYLISESGGAGASVTDFTAVTVDGVLSGEGSVDDGLDDEDGSSTDNLTLTVGAGGEIYGAFDGVNSKQADSISNSGLIEGAGYDGVYEDGAKFGAYALSNAKSGNVVGLQTGLYFSASDAATEKVTNSGLIEGDSSNGIELNGAGASSISNGATGQILGYDAGIYEEDTTGVQTISNKGLIDGYSEYALDFYRTAAALSITNFATGKLLGEYGVVIEDFTGVVTIKNAGLVEGGEEQGIYVYEQTGTDNITIGNALTGQIIGDDGIDVSGYSGPLLISNAGVIEGTTEYGVYASDNKTSATAAFTNAATGNVTAYNDGVYFDEVSGAATIGNAGLVWGEFEDGVEVSDSGVTSITNAANAVIKGKSAGVYVENKSASATLTIINDGTMVGANDSGVYESMGGGNSSITNSSAGEITGDDGIYDSSSSSTRTLINSGYITGTDGDGVDEESSGVFDLTNDASGRIGGTAVGLNVSSSGGLVVMIGNQGQIGGGASDGIYLSTTDSATINNDAAGAIRGLGGIYYSATSTAATLTVDNVGTINGGGGDAIQASGGAAVDFTNSGIVNGVVYLAGLDTVTVTGGTVTGNIDMTASSANDSFTMSGGDITGAVKFGGGTESITMEAGAAGTTFDVGTGTTTFDYKSLASFGTTSATMDIVNSWQTSDVIDVAALLSSSATFGSAVNQNLSNNDDFITLNGSKFSLELAGVTSKLTSANFVV